MSRTPALPPTVALIDEAVCIGCTLCIEACPVDAIVGAAQLMHTVIAQACTGCELCIAPCPVDCISMRPVDGPLTRDERRAAGAQARVRSERRKKRLAGERDAAARDGGRNAGLNIEVVERALARARRRLAEQGPSRK